MADTERSIWLEILCGTPQARQQDCLSALQGEQKQTSNTFPCHLTQIHVPSKALMIKALKCKGRDDYYGLE